jgi:hypothetical protein
VDVGWIVALVGALLGAGGLTALLQARATNKRTIAEASKTSAEGEVTLGGGWQTLWQAARDDAVAARTESKAARAETNELRERVAVIEAQEADCRERLLKLESAAHPAAVESKVVSLIDREITKRQEQRGA